jgi:hypothetical protein
MNIPENKIKRTHLATHCGFFASAVETTMLLKAA